MDLRALAQNILQTPGKVGQWGSENYLYDPKEKIPFPQGMIGQHIRAERMPEGPDKMRARQERMMMPVMGMAGGIKKTPKIHPEDQQVMINLIDNIRLKKPQNLDLELDASRIAEHYKLPMPKTTGRLANTFDQVLTLLRNKNK